MREFCWEKPTGAYQLQSKEQRAEIIFQWRPTGCMDVGSTNETSFHETIHPSRNTHVLYKLSIRKKDAFNNATVL